LKANLNTPTEIASAYFRWEVPVEGVAICLHLNVVQLLDRDATRAGETSAAGVLLGRIEQGRQLTLVIEGYEACTPEGGALESPFKDRRLMDSVIERWSSRYGRMSAVGFYRTCGREGAALSKDDIHTLDASVVRPKASYERKKLSVQESKPGSAPEARMNIKIASKAEPPGVWLTQSERIFVLIEPRGIPGVSASVYLTRGGAILCQSPRLPFNRGELSRKGIVCQSPGASMHDLSAGTELTKPAQHRSGQRPLHNHASEDESRRRRWLLAAAAILALLSVGFFRVSGQQRLLSFPTDQDGSNDSQLGLKLERSGSDWELTWNQAAPILLETKRARLRIDDDFIHKIIDLDPSELRTGRIIYTPITDDVVLHLELEAAEPAKNVSESVRIVAGLLPAMPKAPGRPAKAASDLRADSRWPAPLSTRDGQRTVERKPVAEQAAGLNQTSASVTESNSPSKSEVPSPNSLAGSAEDAPPTDGLPAPSLSATGQMTGIGSDIFVAVPDAVRGEDVQPAELISRMDPVYPQEAKRRNISGTVEVHFKIDVHGQVREATAVRGEPALVPAALEAVKQSRYKPARLDGLATEVEGKTFVNFRPN
jgi:TonB family protein